MTNKQIREGAEVLMEQYLNAFSTCYPQSHVSASYKVRNGAAFFRVAIEGDDGGKDLSTEDLAEAIIGFTRGRAH